MKPCFVSLALFASWMLAHSFGVVESTTVAEPQEKAQEPKANESEPTLKGKTNVVPKESLSTNPFQGVDGEDNSVKADSSQEATTQLHVDENIGGSEKKPTNTSATDTKTEDVDVNRISKEAASSDEANDQKHLSQVGPFIDLLGPKLLKLRQLDEKRLALLPIATNEALLGKKVVGIYFSADWCGPCRQFTPELVSFYNKMNERRGRKGEFEIVWVSRCRDVNSFHQYFTHMNWLAMPLEHALGERGRKLAEIYKVKTIPALVLLDDLGNVITTDARNKIPQDKAGIGFPWRNPIAHLYVTILPSSLRLMIRSHIWSVKDKLLRKLKTIVALKPASVNR